jgi:hypothetical protein
MSEFKPYVRLHILIEAHEALRQVNELPLGETIPQQMKWRVSDAFARLGVYVDLATQHKVEVRMPDPEVTEVA